MGNGRKRATGASGWSALLACWTLTVAGCGISEATAETQGSGADRKVGVVELQKLLLIAAAEGGTGRILGTLVNDSTAPVEVMISDSDDEVTVVVPARASYPFTSREVIFDTVDARPGHTATITVTTPAVSTRVDIPVVDGTKDPYTPYLPG